MTNVENANKNIGQQLLNEMKTGVFAECSRLPRETELSEMLGISRTHLRDILSELEREGFITRRHGIGTMINRHVVNVKNRMDIEMEFFDIIRQNGYEAKSEMVWIHELPADTHLAEKLQVPQGTELIRISRVCTADGKPAIYCEDFLGKRFVKGNYTLEDLEYPIFYFLQKFCDIHAYMDLTELHAVFAAGEVATVLQLVPGTPVLNMEEVDYDIDGKPIFYSNQYFVEGMFKHTVLRKRL